MRARAGVVPSRGSSNGLSKTGTIKGQMFTHWVSLANNHLLLAFCLNPLAFNLLAVSSEGTLSVWSLLHLFRSLVYFVDLLLKIHVIDWLCWFLLTLGENSVLTLLGLPVPGLEFTAGSLDLALVSIGVYQLVDFLSGQNAGLVVVLLLADLLTNLLSISCLNSVISSLGLCICLVSTVKDSLHGKEEGNNQEGKDEDPQIVDWGLLIGFVHFYICSQMFELILSSRYDIS